MKVLNKAFKMTKEELKTFRALDDEKPNMPGAKLTKRESEFIYEMYHKYITKNVDNIDWNLSLEEMERKEKWPSGPRVTMLQAKRIVLGFLEGINSLGNMTDKKAADYFLSSMRYDREASKRLTFYAYSK